MLKTGHPGPRGPQCEDLGDDHPFSWLCSRWEDASLVVGVEGAAQPGAQEWGWGWNSAQDPALLWAQSPFPLRWVVIWNRFCLIEGVGQLSPHWATHAGGVRVPGICPHNRVWSHATLIPSFRLLAKPSTCLGVEVRLADA